LKDKIIIEARVLEGSPFNLIIGLPDIKYFSITKKYSSHFEENKDTIHTEVYYKRLKDEYYYSPEHPTLALEPFSASHNPVYKPDQLNIAIKAKAKFIEKASFNVHDIKMMGDRPAILDFNLQSLGTPIKSDEPTAVDVSQGNKSVKVSVNIPKRLAREDTPEILRDVRPNKGLSIKSNQTQTNDKDKSYQDRVANYIRNKSHDSDSSHLNIAVIKEGPHITKKAENLLSSDLDNIKDTHKLYQEYQSVVLNSKDHINKD
jgi:hypothetical protein